MPENVQTLNKQIKKLKNENKDLKKSFKKLEESNIVLNDKVVELYTLYNISKTLSTTLNLEQLYMLIMELFRESFKVDEYMILIVDEKTNSLEVRASFGIDQESIDSMELFIDQDIFGEISLSKKALLIPDLSKSPIFTSNPILKKDKGSFYCIPLIIQESRVIGILTFHKPNPKSFLDKDLKIFSSVAEQIAISVENAQLYKQTVEIATKDELTGVFNRRYFNNRFKIELQRAARYKRNLGLMIIDIDHFKLFNDTHGHLVGDKVLQKVASTLQYNVRTSDIVARFGGEEFVVLLPETPKENAIGVARKLIRNLKAEDFEGEDTQPKGELTISLGLACFPEDTEDTNPLDLIEKADDCLYVAKENGRDQLRFFGDTTDETKK